MFNFGQHPVALTAIKLRLITIKNVKYCVLYVASSINIVRFDFVDVIHLCCTYNITILCPRFIELFLFERKRNASERESESRQTHVIFPRINCDFYMLIAPTREEQRKNSRTITRAARDTSDIPIKITIIMNKRNTIIKDSINYVSSLYSCILYFLDFLH